MQSLNRQEKIELIELLEEKARRKALISHLDHFNSFYDWQHKFNAATAGHRSCMLMAANRVGKTRTGLGMDALHLLGDYPDNWTGYRFEKAPLCWLLGFSGEKTRDLLQVPLFGRLEGGELQGGIIPKERIVDYKSMTGTSGALREVRVQHETGRIAVCQFWSYSQGQHALMGDSVDWYHVDEEPKDNKIVPQVITRTATGDNGKGGRGILTFTPENGRTELVVKFTDDPSRTQYLQRATWDDAYHLTEDTKEALLEEYPEWQRDMRTKGLPLLGHGLIFDIGDSQIKCEPFECPDHFYVINAMDFGFDHPQAHVQVWWDKDDDTFYLAHAWKKSRVLAEEAWGAVKSWAEYAPTAWPSDGLQTEKGSGRQQKAYYLDVGWNMLHEHATWPQGVSDKNNRSVEHGLVELYRLMRNGKFKVFSTLGEWFDEKMSYHRDEKGKIVKVNDDLLDATRYAMMMRRYALPKAELTGDNVEDELNFSSIF